MKLIIKKSEPVCLTSLRVITNDYNELKDECRIEVIDGLLAETDGLCAYCEKKLNVNNKIVCTIEHYNCQSGDNVDNNLDYNNFFAMCTGKFYMNKLTNDHISHCGNNRSNLMLNIDPRNKEHIDTLYFDDYAHLKSTIDVFQNDINDILNLNFEELINLRIKSFINFFQNLYTSNKKFPKNDEFKRKAFQTLENSKPSYYSFIKFQLNKKLNKPSKI